MSPTASLSTRSAAAAAEPVWRSREAILALAVVVLLLVMGVVTQGRFVGVDNLRDILVNTSIPLVAAAGMTALIVAAQIDISVGAMLAVCAVVVGMLGARGLPVPALIVAAVVCGAGMGAVNGGLTAGLKIPSIVATLATLGAIRGLLVMVTRGESMAIPPQLTELGASSFLGVPFLVWSAILVCWGTHAYLASTRPGRQHYAVGSNPRSSELSGIPVAWVTFRSFLLLGALVGFAGFLFACRFTPIYPTPPRGFELEVITAVVVGGTDIFGGRGTILGTVLAAVLLSIINVALTFLSSLVPLPSETQPAVQGLLILAAVLYNSLSRK